MGERERKTRRKEDVREVGEREKEITINSSIFSLVKEEEMVLCCNMNCGPAWFHLSCANVNELPTEEDWYCSHSCRDDNGYIYCKCHEKKPGANMVQCFLKADCKGQEWYHMVCLGIPDAEVLPGMLMIQ